MLQAGMGCEMNVWPCLAPRPRRERRNMRPRVRLRPGGRLIASDVVGAETLGCCTCGGERSNRNGNKGAKEHNQWCRAYCTIV